MKIACVGYRNWAICIYENLRSKTEHKYLLLTNPKSVDDKKLRTFNPDLILFYGWSNKICSTLIKDYKCLMLHPSPLPKYRGGSPIQNQIINGEKESAVSIFIVNEQIDAGDIVKQEPISLEGNLDEIFDRIIQVGTSLTLSILQEGLEARPQDESEASFYTRRKPSQSEITIEELQTQSSEYLHNKIRMLQDPYPNAYIRTIDGKKLKLKLSEVSDDKS